MKFERLNQKVVESLKSGKIGVIPTDTLYGVAACAADEAAVQKLYRLKKRDKKPGTIIASSIDQLEDLGIKRRYLTAVEQYWPNPLSVIIPTGFNLTYLDQGKMSVPIRIPDDKELLAFLEKTGPLVTSSANHPGEKPADTIHEAKKYFGDEVDFYVDGGNLGGREPSTIIRIIDDAIEVIREGAVKLNENGRITK